MVFALHWPVRSNSSSKKKPVQHLAADGATVFNLVLHHRTYSISYSDLSQSRAFNTRATYL